MYMYLNCEDRDGMMCNDYNDHQRDITNNTKHIPRVLFDLKWNAR